MNCKICNIQTKHAFDRLVLDKYYARFEYCENCGFLSVPEPHWLEESYSNAIASADTGAVARNLQIARKLTAICDKIGKGPYRDIGGGTGLLVRLMRDKGFDFYWSDEYCQNIYAQGFENAPDNCLAVTAFEVLEHTPDPIRFVADALKNAESIIFSQELFDGQPPESWWYYSLSTGQHISFFQKRTLMQISKILELKYVRSLGLHIFTKDINFRPASLLDFALSTLKIRKSLIESDYEKITGAII